MLCCGGKGSGKHGNNITMKKLFLDHSVNKTKTVPRHLSPPGRGPLMEEMGVNSPSPSLPTGERVGLAPVRGSYSSSQAANAAF